MAKGKKVLNSGEYIARMVPEILEQMREEKIEKYKSIVLEAFATIIASDMIYPLGQKKDGVCSFQVQNGNVVWRESLTDESFSIEEKEYLLPILKEIAKELGDQEGQVYMSTPEFNDESELCFILRYNFS